MKSCVTDRTFGPNLIKTNNASSLIKCAGEGDYHLSRSALVTSVFNPIPLATFSLQERSVLQMLIRKGILLGMDETC